MNEPKILPESIDMSSKRKSKKSIPQNFEEFDSLDNEERIRRCIDLFHDVLGEWEASHPHWRVETLLWILDASLKSLRHYIEDDKEPEISWESPFVELHLPVRCSWKEDEEGNSSFRLFSGEITEEDVRDREAMTQCLAEVVVEHIQMVALQEFTNEVGFEKRGEELTAVIEPSVAEFIRDNFAPEDHDREIHRLFRPLSFGAGHVTYKELSGEDGGTEQLEDFHEIGEEEWSQIESIREPLLEVDFEADGRKMRVVTCFEINPPVADYEAKSAYFPIMVGLAVQFDGELAESESIESIIDSASLAEWPQELRSELWELLGGKLKEGLAGFDPEPDPEMVEAIVSVNAQIKFMVPINDKEYLNQAITNLTEYLSKGGELLGVDMKYLGNRLACSGDDMALGRLLEDVEAARSADAKGKSLETLVSALFSSVPAFEVFERQHTESEEIDLWVSNHSNQRPYSDESDVILVECKNWSGKCGKNDFVQLYHKIENRGGRCSIAFLISWNGFADTITVEMLRASREKPLIVPIDGNEIRRAVHSGDFMKVLTAARQKALMV